jgi:hypothetical protein
MNRMTMLVEFGLWHSADAWYGRKAENKKADEGMITFSEAFWREGIRDDI